MGKAVPEQHPAVVLRSHYVHLRALLVAALIAVLGLTGAVVIVANDSDELVAVPRPRRRSRTAAPGPSACRSWRRSPQRRLDGAVDTARPRAMTAGRTRAAPTSAGRETARAAESGLAGLPWARPATTAARRGRADVTMSAPSERPCCRGRTPLRRRPQRGQRRRAVQGQQGVRGPAGTGPATTAARTRAAPT